MKNESCIDVKRDICDNPSIVLMNKEEFKKVFQKEAYLKVIVNPDYKEAEMSKSYYYYILEKLKKINLIDKDNKLTFTIIVSFQLDERDFAIKFEPILVFLSKNRKILYIFDVRKRCNVDEELLKELGMNDKRQYSCRKIIENIYKLILESILNKGVIYV
ncbi:hypothetical protein [Acidianus manzaensis]|uniref:Uncharacterized protein n=1 Tax=Acidianus manzaensis TaxID=282676 RepID=A0A1W6K390_9CREN|nr:hypothetical protein [Acidianus manzaensis]ARM76902.1 hypothetical protein B6F84_13325 [Acidianus manzaensis]